MEETRIKSFKFTQNEIVERLTKNEIYYAKYILKGLTPEQIATETCKSKDNIESFIYKLKKKLYCNKRSDLIARLRELNLDKIL